MRVHVVSDVHGNADALARAGDGADALICLGDLVLFLDYADHARGILAELFGAETADRFVGAAHRPPLRRGPGLQPVAVGHGRRPGRGGRRGGAPAVRASCSPPSRPRRTLTYGNVDVPTAVAGVRPAPACTVLDGERGRDRRLAVRVRRRRAAHADADAVRGRRRGVRGQGRRGRRGGRALLAHPAGGARADSTTPSPAASSGAARRCWRRSGDPAAVRPVRARAPAAAAADADRPHRVRERRPLPRPRGGRGR